MKHKLIYEPNFDQTSKCALVFVFQLHDKIFFWCFFFLFVFDVISLFYFLLIFFSLFNCKIIRNLKILNDLNKKKEHRHKQNKT